MLPFSAPGSTFNYNALQTSEMVKQNMGAGGQPQQQQQQQDYYHYQHAQGQFPQGQVPQGQFQNVPGSADPFKQYGSSSSDWNNQGQPNPAFYSSTGPSPVMQPQPGYDWNAQQQQQQQAQYHQQQQMQYHQQQQQQQQQQQYPGMYQAPAPFYSPSPMGMPAQPPFQAAQPFYPPQMPVQMPMQMPMGINMHAPIQAPPVSFDDPSVYLSGGVGAQFPAPHNPPPPFVAPSFLPNQPNLFSSALDLNKYSAGNFLSSSSPQPQQQPQSQPQTQDPASFYASAPSVPASSIPPSSPSPSPLSSSHSPSSSSYSSSSSASDPQIPLPMGHHRKPLPVPPKTQGLVRPGPSRPTRGSNSRLEMATVTDKDALQLALVSIEERREKAVQRCKLQKWLFVDDRGFEDQSRHLSAPIADENTLLDFIQRPIPVELLMSTRGLKRYSASFRLSLDCRDLMITCKNKVTHHETNNFTEIRIGPKSTAFQHHIKTIDPSLCFVLVYRKHTISMIAQSSRDFTMITQALKHFISKMKEEDSFTTFLMSKWRSFNTNTVMIEQLVDLFAHLGIKTTVPSLRFSLSKSGCNSDTVTLEQTVACLELMLRRPEVETFIRGFAKNPDSGISFGEILLLMKSTQQQLDLTLDDLIDELATYITDVNSRHISFAAFEHYLLSPLNQVMRPEHQEVYQDMTQPLNNYFINSSHNTYLEDGQLRGFSSIEQYSRVLKTGCRCIELDCWDGKSEPEITHGNTLTTRIPFRGVIETIRNDGFLASDYPLILSLEVHCSLHQQSMMAAIMEQELGRMLATRRTFPLVNGRLPSPEDLKGKILLKGPTNSSAVIADDSKPLKVAENFERLIYLSTMPYKSVSVETEAWQMCSFSETAAPKSSEFRKYNSFYLSRIYPKGTRINSDNYNPQKFWNDGSQLVALNLQTSDLPVWLNHGKFRDNGKSGYVLKPPELLCSPGDDLPSSPLLQLEISDISARALPSTGKDVINPHVVFTAYGSQTVSAQTHVIENNGLNPGWPINLSLLIPDHLNSVFLIQIKSGSTVLCWASLPVKSIRPGYRLVPLNGPDGLPCQLASLFCRFLIG